MRSLLWIGVPFAIAGAIAACSSFSGDGGSTPTSDAGPGGGGDDDSTTTSDSSVPPCERAGLYVVGGFDVEHPAAGLPAVETTKILRVPIYCDGTLGPAVTLPDEYPRSFIWGGAVTFGESVVTFGGSHDTGGEALVQTSYVAKRVPGSLGLFELGTSYPAFESWRFGLATNGTRAFVAGGRLRGVTDQSQAPPGTFTEFVDAGAQSYYAVFTSSVDVLDFDGTAVRGKHVGDLYTHGERGAVAFAHNRLLAYGTGTDTKPADSSLYWADVKPDDSLSSWNAIAGYAQNEFDGAAVANGDDVYVFGGQSRQTAWGRVDMSTDPPTLKYDSGNPMKDEDGQPSPHPDPRAVTAFGNVYFIDTQSPYVQYAALERTGLVIKRGPSLGRRRSLASLFIF